MAEFQGRCPTLQEVFGIPPDKWLKVPGIGRALLMELEAIMQDRQDRMKDHASPGMTDAQLLEQLERLQRDLNRIRHDFLSLMRERQRRDINPDSPDLASSR